VSKHKSVNLSLPQGLLRRFRLYATKRKQSMSSIMAHAMQKWMDEEDEREAAGRRFLDRCRNAPDLGTHGQITWTREELYER
jgi:hypothetical protein